MQIRKNELKKKYGIDLDKGKYKIIFKKNAYQIYVVKDDTEGCLLTGMNKEVGKVLDSKIWLDVVITKIKQYDKVNIIIRNNN